MRLENTSTKKYLQLQSILFTGANDPSMGRFKSTTD